MQVWLKRCWPFLKALLALAIVAGVGWQFARILGSPELWQEPWTVRPGWLVLSALLYLAGLGFPCWFWYRLLGRMGQKPKTTAVIRAYYVGHLGKYVPGKAWAVLLRAALVRGPEVRTSVAVLSATYETLTTMAAGALVALVLLGWLATEDSGRGWQALGLLALAGVPILPGIFNRIVRFSMKTSATLENDAGGELSNVPPLTARTLAGGLLQSGCGWLILGLSLWAMVQALRPELHCWDWTLASRYTAYLALAYVAGFLTLPAPGGLGVRELILQQFLAPELGPLAVVAVLLLRLLWTIAELVMAASVYWLPLAASPAPATDRT
jgi:hypothetical protein